MMNPRQFTNDQSGNVMLTFALGSAALLAAVGGGVEIVRVADGKSTLQGAVDAAALAAAGMPESATSAQRTALAEKVFNANLANMDEVVPGSVILSPNYSVAGQVTLTSQAGLKTILGSSIFGASHTIHASATALKGVTASPSTPTNCAAPPAATAAPVQVIPSPPPAVSPPPTSPPPSPPPSTAEGCVWAIGTGSNPNGFLFNSGNTINAPLCQMHGHGSGNASVMWNHGNNVTVNKLFTKGGITANGPWQSWFEANAGSNVANDPYATGLTQPSSSTPCTFNNFTANGAVTLDPGVYCGNTNLNANGATVTMNPGLYVIRNADFNINGGNVQATGGVTIFHESDHRFALNGGSSLNIVAPTSGPYAGLAIYEKYGLSNNDKYYPIDANGGISITGIIYLPTRHLTFNSGSSLRSNAVRIVGKTVNFSGTNWNMTPYNASPPPPPPPVSPPPSPPSPPPLPVSGGTGLITNGSFENPALTPGTMANWGSLTSVPGWSSTRTFEIHNAAFWTNGGGYGTDGVQYAEIERDLTQSVNLPANRTYALSVDYRYGDNGNTADNRFEVVWNNQVLATINPPAATSTTPATWQRIVFPIRGGGAPVNLTFRQVSTADFNHGAFLDRVRIVEDASLTAPLVGCPGGLPAPPPPPPSPLRIKN